MDSTQVSAHDPRVVAILTNPDDYFSKASRRAWAKARADIAAEVNRRARQRSNNNRHEDKPPSVETW
ncbi:MAG: hypothetical protein GEU96_09595 [Propionibacteriales bacterium]|nr:hypothetical protein [Propionibacteriales bacterium]